MRKRWTKLSTLDKACVIVFAPFWIPFLAVVLAITALIVGVIRAAQVLFDAFGEARETTQ